MPQSSSGAEWKTKIFYASRSKVSLAQFAFGMVAAGFVVGLVAHRFHRDDSDELVVRILARAGLPIELDDDELAKLPPADELPEGPNNRLVPACQSELGRRGVQFFDVITGMPALVPHLRSSDFDALRDLLQHRFGATEAEIAIDYAAALNLGNQQAYAALESLANRHDAPRFANYALGRVELRRKDYRAAVARFEREGERPEAYEARYRVVDTLLIARDYRRLAALHKDPRYAEFFSAYTELKIAAGTHDWRKMLWLSPQVQFSGYTATAIAMSAIAGMAWAFFLGHLGEFRSPFTATAVLAGVAVVAGIASTIPTMWIVTWQEDMLHVAAGEEPIRILLYYIAGVATREELCKLLLFLPLIPALLRRDDELEALTLASFVGLGFAIEENANYFLDSAGTVAAGRFLSANFFHIALTGVNGLALYRGFRWGARGWNEFLWVFPLSIAAHGAYDAVQDMPDLAQGGYIAMLVFVGFCYLYFDRCHALRTHRRMIVGVTGAFIAGVSLVLAAFVAHQVAIFGAVAGLTEVFSEAIGSALLIVVFVHIFNDRITS